MAVLEVSPPTSNDQILYLLDGAGSYPVLLSVAKALLPNLVKDIGLGTEIEAKDDEARKWFEPMSELLSGQTLHGSQGRGSIFVKYLTATCGMNINR